MAADTATKILDAAEELVQKRGFNGFSYADVAGVLNITTASLHYHFPGKAELGNALISRYTTRFAAALNDIGAGGADARARLQAYAGLYAAVLNERRLCLCGMLAAEYETLPGPMREAVLRFFDQNEAWLADLLSEGRDAGQLQFAGAPAETARMIVCGLEGAMLVARPYGDTTRFQSAASQLISSLMPGPTNDRNQAPD